MFGNPGNIYFVVEIIAAEMIFLYSYPKRRLFILRALLAFVVIMTSAYFLPYFSVEIFGKWASLFRFLLLWSFTVAGMCFCFSASVASIVSACAAGYALQHFSYKLLALLKLTGIFDFIEPVYIGKNFVKELIVFPLPYLAAYFTFGRLSAKNRYYKNTDMRFNILSVATIFICIVLNRFTVSDRSAEVTICTALYSMTCTLLALIVQFNLRQSCEVKEENSVIHKVLQEKEKQYETSKNNIDLLNIKCHDLKYTISGLDGRLPKEEIDSINSLISAYDAGVKTGNDVLDVLLIEKSMKCDALGIKFTCMGDGSKLSFMTAVDIYSLFGNALDNAIEAVSRLTVSEMKQIGLTIETKDDLVVVSTFNYFAGKLDMMDGLPTSTKQTEPGYHGYGLKSIKMIAEKYNGGVRISTKNDIFNLGIFMKT